MAESYTVLARRYRSQSFDQLVGQDAIAQTLKNAITSGRVAHAFLFTGTRGVGKTSAARILAKALNCPNSKDGDPCNTCDTCKAIGRGEDMDVIEIDGASNNGVDQVRELRQSAGIRPARSPYKIYIIDEVHMLSTGAFNALLKTLEEPPSHVKFIFATTDAHKVPATIISRVQRFDFKNIATQKIADHLKTVVAGENLQADPEAIHRIARLGNGSMRDALSILDRVLSLGQSHLTEKLLEDLLGKPATAAIAELVTALANQDPAAALISADALLKEGMGPEQLLGELIEFLRNLMIVSTCGNNTDLLDVPTESRPIFITLAAKYDAPSLVHLISLCEHTVRALKATTMARPMFDALIVRLALTEQFSTLKQLLANSPSEGQKKNDIAPAPGLTPAGVTPTGGMPSGVGAPVGLNSVSAPAEPEPIPSQADDAPPPEDDREESIYDTMKTHMARKVEERNAAVSGGGGGTPTGSGAMPASSGHASVPSSEPLSFSAQMRAQLAAAPRPVPNRPSSSPRPTGPAAPAAPAAPVTIIADLANLPAIWQAVLQHLAANKAASVTTMLGSCSHLESVTPTLGTLCIPTRLVSYAGPKIQSRIEESLRAVTAQPGLQLQLSTYESDDSHRPANPASPTATRISPETLEAVRQNPTIQSLITKLGGDITAIEPLESPSSPETP